jgi:autotransporter-associated beta strand protein
VGIDCGGYGMVLGCPMEIGPYYLDANGNQVMVGTTTVLNDNSSPTGDIIHLPDRQLTIPAVAASAPWAGQNIGVALLQTATPANEGGYWDIDNVRLVATTSPTPTAVWTGAAAGNTNWSCSGNWSGVLSASGASLTFVNPGSGHAENTNDFPAGTPFAAITFAAGSPAYNLQGNAIQLSGPVANQSNINQTIGLDMQVVAGGGTLDTGSGSMTIAGAISGLSLTKLGAGSLILSGSNTYLGGTTVSGGTLSISSVGNLGGGNVALNGGALRTTADLILHAGRTVTLNATCSTIQTDNANTEIDSLLTGLGGLAKTGTGTLTLTNPANSTTGFTGGTTLFSGALEYTDPLAVDSGSVIFAGGSLILDFSGLVGSGSVATGLSQSIAIEPALAGFAGAAPALTVPSVPEPGTLGLLGAGLLAGLVVWLRRRRG